MSCSLKINKLIVVGMRKNYEVNFAPGVNIIYGDSATGKSSILNLVDYLLGAKKFSSYPEIETVCRYAALDLMLNDVRYTIKRDIFNPSSLIEVYQCSFDKIKKFPSTKYIPGFKFTSKYEGFEIFPEFLFNALNIANLKLKSSPSKDDSAHSRLSFRDLIKYCYVDQDDLGSKRFLDRGNPVLETRNAQVFKYIFNALDSQISDIEQEISIKTKLKSMYEKKFISVSEFLRDSDFGNMQAIDNEIADITDRLIQIEENISEINTRATANNETYRAAKDAVEELEVEVKNKQQIVQDHENKIDQFTRLKNDYLLDIKKFLATQEARKVIGKLSREISLCPVCDNILEVAQTKSKFEVPVEGKIVSEVNSLKRRVRDTESLADENRKKWELGNLELFDLTKQRDKARHYFDIHAKDLVSPYISERDTYISQFASLNQQKNDLTARIRIRNQHKLLADNTEVLRNDISKLHEKLNVLKENAPSLTDITSSMADILKDFLEYINIKDPSGISINNNKYLPIVRGVNYIDITSGGLRTITCIGYLCSFVLETLEYEMNYPAFLMIDTVGKYLGKTKDGYKAETSNKADLFEGASDPSKYQNIYEYIIKIAERFEKKNKMCQFILVDNDVPRHIITDLQGFIVAHFSSERINGLPVGFIDDAHLDV